MFAFIISGSAALCFIACPNLVVDVNDAHVGMGFAATMTQIPFHTNVLPKPASTTWVLHWKTLVVILQSMEGRPPSGALSHGAK